jgi:hypothetical protein
MFVYIFHLKIKSIVVCGQPTVSNHYYIESYYSVLSRVVLAIGYSGRKHLRGRQA